MTTITEEEENYVRMSLLVFGISQRAARVLFDSEFAPQTLQTSIRKEFRKLVKLKKDKIINQSQWNLLFPQRGVLPDSSTFDVTLIITLLRHLISLKPPDNGFDKLPSETNSTPSAALATIKYYRNYIAHLQEAIIKTSYFNKAWNNITGAVERLGGKHMLEECKELRTKVLEQSTVPWNRREQISQILEVWKMTNSTFFETRASKDILKCVHENSCVTITGGSGVGKTATLQHVVLKMIDEGYDVLPVTNAYDIVKFYNPNQKTLFVMDDFCGTYSINQFDFSSLESVMKVIKGLIQNKLTKIIVACRLQVYQDKKFESLSIFRTCVCNLLSKDFCLSPKEKQSIAKLYLNTQQTTEIIQYCDLYDCFPLLCKLYSDNSELNLTDFFKNPFSVYEAELKKLDGNGKYCVLALCVMSNNSLKEEWFTEEIDPVMRAMIENTCEASRLDKGTSRLVLLDELKSLENSFIKKEQGIYKTIHDKLFDFFSHYFGQNMTQCMIKNSDPLVIMQRFILEKTDDMNQFIIVVSHEYHQMYMQRLIDEWSKGEMKCVFSNINMEKPEFRHRLLGYVQTLDISLQRQLAHTCDVYNKDTVLVPCCEYEDIPLIQWCFYHGVDVNQCNRFDFSPLFVTVLTGNTKVLKLLLDNKADIDKCVDGARSPLLESKNDTEIRKTLHDILADMGSLTPFKGFVDNFYELQFKNTLECLVPKNTEDLIDAFFGKISALCMAVSMNKIEIVKVLLDNKADINKCLNHGESPLFIACMYRHIEMVKVLLDNKADINKCLDNGSSPLFIACLFKQIEIVKLLLDNKADIDTCLCSGESPLFVACLMNHIETVKILLDNKADINKCKQDGASPLLVACHRDHIEIVKILLDNKADINKCVVNGVSPLACACVMNNKEIVKILLDNNANVNTCTIDGVTPLANACTMNQIEIVKILLDNNADTNKCRIDGASPLMCACLIDYIEIVNIKEIMAKVMIDGALSVSYPRAMNDIAIANIKETINKSFDNLETPSLLTCQENHKEIINILLDHNADINTCTKDGASPLFAACQGNHIEIVQILLDNKADINKCVVNGVSPLACACVMNNKEIVKILLDNNANVNTCTIDGVTPLANACTMNQIEIVKILLDNNAEINKCMIDGASPLMCACSMDHIGIVNIKENMAKDMIDGTLSFCDSRAMNHIEIEAIKARVNRSLDNWETLSFITCQENHIKIVKILLDHKADINKCTKDGASPLYIACQWNRVEIVKVLLDNKAEINKCRDDGESPLFGACKKNHIEIVKLLLDNKADINACTKDGTSPFFVACQANHIEIVKLLLDNKADINKCMNNGVSPLFVACQENRIEIVDILLDNNADINKCSDGGAFPVRSACSNNHNWLTMMLLGKGSNYNAYAKDGISPIEIARQMGHINIVNMINKHSRKEEPPSKKIKFNNSPPTTQRRSPRKKLNHDQLNDSPPTTQRRSPRKKLNNNQSGYSSYAPQSRSPRKNLQNDQLNNSPPTTQRRSPRKKLNNNQVVKLVENASFTVSSKELRKIVLKAKGEKNTGFYLVLKLTDLVFSMDEMGHSRCQGLKPAKSGDTRLPLDAEKIKTVKAYSEGFCRKNGRKQATNAEMNRAISQAVAYSRKKLKKQLTIPI